jgi:molybdopterin synthase catalytic subunit
MITIKLFARLREICGKSEVVLDPHIETLAGVLEQIKRELPELSGWIEKGKVLISVNQEMADFQRPIRDGDEIGLMPPFSGGAVPWGLPDQVRIQQEVFDLEAEIRQIKSVSGRMGAVVSFLGTVRDFSEWREVQAIYFEHYPVMAEKYLQGLRQRVLKKFDLIEVRIRHRIGTIPAGGDILCVLVASEHRAVAFEACRWCVDELKRTVPLWKKEITPDGAAWVKGGEK